MKVYNKHGMAQRDGTGIFPRETMKRFPLLPLEEEGRLNDLPLRENFIERVFGLRRKARLSAWQFACGKLHDRIDPNAGGGADARRPGPWPVGSGHLCLRTSAGRQVPHRPQADAHGPPWQRHQDRQPILTRGQATTSRWVASSPTQVSGTGMNSPLSTGPCSWKA